MNARLLAMTELLAVLVLGCFVSVLAKYALTAVDPFTFVWIQIAIGTAFLCAYTFGLRGERIPRGLDRQSWLLMVGIGVGNFAIVRVLFLLALGRLPINTHNYLVNFVGIVTLLMSAVFLRERASVVQILGSLIALVGVRVFFRELPPPEEMLGVVFIAVGIVVLATTNTLARRIALRDGDRVSNTIVSTVALLAGGLPVVAVGLATDFPPAVPDLRHWGILLASGFVSVALGMTVFNHVLRTLRSYEASILASLSVILVPVFSLPILGERLDGHQMAGIGLLLLGVVLSQLRREVSVDRERAGAVPPVPSTPTGA